MSESISVKKTRTHTHTHTSQTLKTLFLSQKKKKKRLRFRQNPKRVSILDTIKETARNFDSLSSASAMAEHQSSAEAVPAEAPELHRKGKDSEGEDGNQEEQGKAREGEERVSESSRGATESQRGELQGSEKPLAGSNSETLAVESVVVNNRSHGTVRFQ